MQQSTTMCAIAEKLMQQQPCTTNINHNKANSYKVLTIRFARNKQWRKRMWHDGSGKLFDCTKVQ